MTVAAKTLVPDFERCYMAVERVERLLKRTCVALDDAGIDYAVVGGNAVAAWVGSVDEDAIRFTKDVDILLRRDDLPQAAAALGAIGLVQEEVLGVTVFVDRDDPSPRRGVHVVFANERVREHYAHPSPDVVDSSRAAAGHRVVELAALVRMKLQSFRLVDKVHIQDMLSVGLITDALAAELPADLRERLDQIRATPEG